MDGDRPRAVLVGAQVERDELRRARQLGARRARERAHRRTTPASCATRSRSTPSPGQRVLVLATADGTFTDGAEATLPAGRTRGARAAGRHRARRRAGHAAVLRRPGRDGEGDQRRQQRHRRRGRATRRAGRLARQRRRHHAARRRHRSVRRRRRTTARCSAG